MEGLEGGSAEAALERVGETERAVRDIVERRLITSHFQPILDLHHGTVMAWEVLSRGPDPLSSPTEIFATAEREPAVARWIACSLFAKRISSSVRR